MQHTGGSFFESYTCNGRYVLKSSEGHKLTYDKALAVLSKGPYAPRFPTTGVFMKTYAMLMTTVTVLAGCAGSPPPDAKTAPTETAANTNAAATTASADAGDREILAVIESFLAAPNKEDGIKIHAFVMASPKVMVVIRQSLVPANAGDDGLLVHAFEAGNVRAQLAKGTKGDTPLEGVRSMLTVYRKLKEKTPTLKVQMLEDFAAKESSGTLESTVQNAAK